MAKSFDKIEFWKSGEWTMVYLNGELVKYGDHYLADEWLQTYAGVKVVDDEHGCCIPDGRNALKLLTDAEANMVLLERRKARAAELRAQAEAILADAAKFEKSWKD